MFTAVRIAFLFFCCLSASSNVQSQEALESLKKRVKGFSAAYAESLRNLECSLEGIDPDGLPFHGRIAILNGVLPYQFSTDGAFAFIRSPADGSEDVAGSESIKVGNPQYSFKIKKQSENEGYVLIDLIVPTGDPGRLDLSKDPIFFSFSSTDAESLWSPIMVFDLPTGDLLDGDQGVEVAKLDPQSNGETYVEFKFPAEHPLKHEWARVIFGKSGEVLQYEIQNRPKPEVAVKYVVKIMYADPREENSALLPSEFHFRSNTKFGTEPSVASPELVIKLGNFEFGKSFMEEFTLSHYGIPEPDGTSVLGGPLPYWLLGTLAAAGFLALGIYLRKKSD